jgi:hypothetical protein
MSVKLPELPEIEGVELAAVREPLSPWELRLRRAIVDENEFWSDCPRPECGMAGACRSRSVACFDERRQDVVDAMIPFIYEGYLDENGEEL